MEIIRFATNTVEELALAYSDGKEVDGRYGPQVLYTLTDGRVMYLTTGAAKKLDALKLAKGELFQICKRETKDGQKRGIEWEVKRVEAAPVQAAPVAQAVHTNGNGNGNGPKLAVINTKALEEEQAAVAQKMVSATMICDALKTAIAAAAAAEEFGKSINYAVRFEAQHVYGMACTILIGKQRENGGYR